jgi:hypothetical protein
MTVDERHTPGPYRVHVGYKGSGPWGQTVIEAGPESGGTVICTINTQIPEGAANAALIVHALSALKSDNRPLIEFARWAIQEGSWVSADIPGDVVQDKAEELGLIIRTKYDPEIHGESDIAEPGDDWYVFGPLIAEQDAKP